METLALSQLTAFVRRVFALNLPEAVWVSAELAQVNESRGHTWLTLVEKDPEADNVIAQLDAVVWAGVHKKLQKAHGIKLLRGVLQEGMSVRLQVTASFHARFGLKLLVEDIDPEHTIGSLERRRQATLENLHAAGLLDRNARLPLPALPQRLAVISADTAAGLADFQNQLEQNPYGYAFRTELYPAAMQGAQTGEEISTRLRQIARRRRDYDAIVLVRGGGGKTDLAAFNEEALCRALADAPLPILAGIGHEVDDTVADRVVHRSLKTPTAVAVYLIERLLQAERQLLQLGRTIGQTAENSLYHERARLANMELNLHRSAEETLERARTQLKHQGELLDALRPEATLARGYALVSQDGRLLTSPAAVTRGTVDVRLREGRLRLTKD